MKISLIANAADPLAKTLHDLMTAEHQVTLADKPQTGHEGVVYFPGSFGKWGAPNDAAQVDQQLKAIADSGIPKVVILSSAAIHPPRHTHPCLVGEIKPARASEDPIAGPWIKLELAAATHLKGATLLRPAATPVKGGACLMSRRLGKGVGVTIPGHDPSIQVLHPEDLAQAIMISLDKNPGGTFNVAPKGEIAVNKALKAAGTTNLPVPRWIQGLTRAVLKPAGVMPLNRQQSLRFSWTVSDQKIRTELGFEPKHSSAQAAAQVGGRQIDHQEHDPWGQDKGYLDVMFKTTLGFLHNLYWRVESSGMEHIPATGPVMLVGVHRGFMPFDGAMALYQIAKQRNRYVRFLIHPCLIKPAFQADFIRKIGGVPASSENAKRLFDRDELVGVFPEGIAGAFSLYKDAYKPNNFGRDAYLKIAIRNQVPIVPFVTAGSAEIYPILGKIYPKPLLRYFEWPCVPITASPVPLPSKWHTQYMEPIPINQLYSPDVADDSARVREIGRDIERQLFTQLNNMREERRSIFFGSIFPKTVTE